MKPGSDLYEDVAQVYARLVEHECPDAATAIRQIHSTAGSHAALRAALVIKLLKMEIQQNHYLPNLRIYAYLFEDYSAVAGLLEQAIGCCLQSWGIPDVLVQLQNGNRPQLTV